MQSCVQQAGLDSGRLGQCLKLELKRGLPNNLYCLLFASASCQCSSFTNCMSLSSDALQRLLDLPTLTSWQLLAAQS